MMYSVYKILSGDLQDDREVSPRGPPQGTVLLTLRERQVRRRFMLGLFFMVGVPAIGMGVREWY